MAEILISGGSGLIGGRLSEMLEERGDRVRHLSRSNRGGSPWPIYRWDIKNQYLQDQALDGVNTVIHLAGAGVADERWTASRKKEIMDSRVKSAGLLYHYIEKRKDRPSCYISASAVGYYGSRGDEWLHEDDSPGEGFLSEVCQEWEASADAFESLGMRVVKIRIGVVLSAEGGALEKITLSMPFGLAATLGSGKQYMPWIHLEDICGIFAKAAADTGISGVYNGVAPGPVTYNELLNTLIDLRGWHGLKVPAPAWGLKLAMGQMADAVLMSSRASGNKVREAGYAFRYSELADALKAIYHLQND